MIIYLLFPMGEKKVFYDRNKISELLNIAISTSKIKHLFVRGIERTAQLHCIIYGDIGTAKSTMLYKIGQNIDMTPIVSMSKANLYGTVDKQTGILNPPTVWDCRNSCLLVDEFGFNTHNYNELEVINALLPILVYPRIHKRLGFRVNDIEEKDGDLFLRAKNGKLECKTRFVFIATTMTNINILDSSSNKAILSRCLPIPHYPSYEDLYKYSGDELTFFEYEPYKVREDIKINDSDYDYLRRFARENVRKPYNYLRTLNDLCKVFAVLRKHDESLYTLICTLRAGEGN